MQLSVFWNTKIKEKAPSTSVFRDTWNATRLSVECLYLVIFLCPKSKGKNICIRCLFRVLYVSEKMNRNKKYWLCVFCGVQTAKPNHIFDHILRYLSEEKEHLFAVYIIVKERKWLSCPPPTLKSTSMSYKAVRTRGPAGTEEGKEGRGGGKRVRGKEGGRERSGSWRLEDPTCRRLIICESLGHTATWP